MIRLTKIVICYSTVTMNGPLMKANGPRTLGWSFTDQSILSSNSKSFAITYNAMTLFVQLNSLLVTFAIEQCPKSICDFANNR